jgi:hypothetical protein
VCSWILKFLTDRADDGRALESPLVRVALFGSRYKLGAPIVDSRVSHRPVTNEWLTGYILETFFIALLDISAFNALKWRRNALKRGKIAAAVDHHRPLVDHCWLVFKSFRTAATPFPLSKPNLN